MARAEQAAREEAVAPEDALAMPAGGAGEGGAPADEAIEEGLAALMSEDGGEDGSAQDEEARRSAPGGEGAPRKAREDRLAILRAINGAVERARRRAQRALSRQRGDAYSAVVEIAIRDRAVWDAFLRSFVATDVCASRLEGEMDLSLIGRTKRAALAAQLEEMVDAFRADQAQYLGAARELAARLLQGVEGEELIVPVVEAPVRERLYVHSPISMKLVRALQDADAMIAELETLRWNGLRRASEVNEERSRIRREAARIGRFAYRTTIHLRHAARVVAARRAQPSQAAGGAGDK